MCSQPYLIINLSSCLIYCIWYTVFGQYFASNNLNSTLRPKSDTLEVTSLKTAVFKLPAHVHVRGQYTAVNSEVKSNSNAYFILINIQFPLIFGFQKKNIKPPGCKNSAPAILNDYQTFDDHRKQTEVNIGIIFKVDNKIICESDNVSDLTSVGVFEYSFILSTETIFVSMSLDMRTIQFSDCVTYNRNSVLIR